MLSVPKFTKEQPAYKLYNIPGRSHVRHHGHDADDDHDHGHDHDHDRDLGQDHHHQHGVMLRTVEENCEKRGRTVRFRLVGSTAPNAKVCPDTALLCEDRTG